MQHLKSFGIRLKKANFYFTGKWMILSRRMKEKCIFIPVEERGIGDVVASEENNLCFTGGGGTMKPIKHHEDRSSMAV